jgi:predicted AlkP superfamily phosphohydrolase/phosphomutase/tetratricopeptide (TPR) repeat protein
MSNRLAKKVLLVGWDAADWKTITPLMDAGLMPSLESLVNRGVMGNIATLDPPLSPMLWTSIATGKTADQHGVLGFVQPDDTGKRVRPVLGTTRKVKAVWNIFNQEGLRSNVVGWWPSHPAEPINGAMVSNFYHVLGGHIADPKPMPPDTVHPPAFAQTLEHLRIHPQELTGNHLLPFVPLAAEIPDGDGELRLVAKTIAEAASIQQAATWLMEHSEWDFMAVYFDAIDHFGHGFMKYHPPKRPGVPDEGYQRYKGVIDAGYRFHDMMLGRLLELAGDDTTVILVSDHGFHSDHLRPVILPYEPAGPALEHRDFGVFVMAGAGVKQDERVYGASLLDVAPTLLTLFGLPIGRDMAGKPLVTSFEDEVSPSYVDSWEDIDGDDGRHSPEARRDPWAEQEAMRQLVELGYIEGGQGVERAEKTVRESQFYLGRVHLFNGDPDKALPLFREAFDADEEAERYGLRLAETQRRLGLYDEAHATLDRVMEGRQRLLARSIENLTTMIAEKAAGQGGKEPAKLAHTRDQMKRQLEATPPGLQYHRGLVHLASGDAEAALASFEDAGEAGARFPILHTRIGEAFLRLGRWDEAEVAFQKALERDPHLPSAHRGLALSYLRRDRPEEAAGSALEAIGLQYHFPAAHFHLGEALMRMGDHKRAAQALEVAVSQNPGIRLAHTYLSELYRTHLDNPAKAAEHTRFAAEQIVAG